MRGVQAALLVWLLIMVFTAAVRHLITSGQAAEAIAGYRAMEKQSAETAPQNDDRVAKLLANNLFVPKAQVNTPPQCVAILGDAALFGDKWYKVGDTVENATIQEIGPNFVKVQWNDKEHLLHPFDVEVKYAASPSAPPSPQGSGSAPSAQASAASAPSAPPPDESRRRSGGRFDLEQMRRRFESLTPEQRQQMFERYQNASPEERERMREEFRQGRSNER